MIHMHGGHFVRNPYRYFAQQAPSETIDQIKENLTTYFTEKIPAEVIAGIGMYSGESEGVQELVPWTPIEGNLDQFKE
jgi:hypothetical protein